MITEDYVSFEIAKLLKKKGFNEQTDCSYIIDNINRPMVKIGDFVYNPNNESHRIAAPTLQVTMKWLREVHKVYIEIHTYFDEEPVEYNAICYKDGIYNDTLYYTTEYEDAVNNAIKYCLENLI